MLASIMYGPSYEPQEPDEFNIELFADLGEAITAMFNRHRAHGRQPLNVDLLAGQSTALTFPAFSVSTYFQLYEIDAEPGTIYSPLPVVTYTMEKRREIVEQVNTREWDWHLSLNNDGYDTYVKVSKA